MTVSIGGMAPDMRVREARDSFLDVSHLDTSAYTKPKFPVHLIPGVTFQFPNPGLLPLHDLHHVATGYPATLLGEAQVSAWELRAGSPSPMVKFYCVGAILMGCWSAPGLVIRAWRAGRGARSLYCTGIPYETLLDLRVDELRRLVGLPELGCVKESEE
jgi:hypothetical protein